MKKEKLLKKYFGYDHFRPLQEEAITTILDSRDLLMILPNGERIINPKEV
jgi:ATP-dependent DNA helicase RecQ